jgi:hypothetical protein
MREIERGGLFTLDETSLLRMVFAKAESVLLARNLKSYTEGVETTGTMAAGTYSDEEVKIKIGAL